MRESVAGVLLTGSLLLSGILLLCGRAGATTVNQADNFINLVYVDLLNRPADVPAYQAFEQPLVNHTITSTQVAATVLGGSEYRTDLVDSYYSSYLNRAPQGGELSGALGYLAANGTDQGLQDTILGSPEFFARQGGTSSAFVAALFTDLLQRPGSPAEWAPFITDLSSQTPAQVASLFLSSGEYDDVLVTGYFSRFLNRAPNPSELNLFATEMQGGATNEQVIASILGSAEFFQLAQSSQAPEPGSLGLGGVAVALLLAGRVARRKSPIPKS